MKIGDRLPIFVAAFNWEETVARSKSPSTVSAEEEIPLHSFDIEHFVPYRLLRLTGQITNLASKEYEDRLGITIAESRVVNLIAAKGPMSTFEISDLTKMDRAKVSRASQRLTAAGRLTRTVNEQDSRLIRLSLTPKGRKLHEGILEIVHRFEVEVSNALGNSGPDELLVTLDKLDKHFSKLVL